MDGKREKVRERERERGRKRKGKSNNNAINLGGGTSNPCALTTLSEPHDRRRALTLDNDKPLMLGSNTRKPRHATF